jgi:glycine cleavage system aminomethyltransferase T
VIGLTAIETDLAERGTRVEVALGDASASATVDSLPLYDLEKRRPRS